MIYLFHKLDKAARPDVNWISVAQFRVFLENHGPYKYLTEYVEDRQCDVITFDGVYENVWENGMEIFKRWQVPFEMFVVMGSIGKDNRWDQAQPLTRFCSGKQLADLESVGGRIEHHSFTHRDLTRLSADEIDHETRNPYGRGFFAYPHGRLNQQVEKIVAERFTGAVGVNGDDSRFNLKRIYYG